MSTAMRTLRALSLRQDLLQGQFEQILGSAAPSSTATCTKMGRRWGTKNQPDVFLPTVFCPPPPGSWTSAHSGHGCPHPHACSPKVSSCPKFLSRDVHTNDPGTSVGYPAQKLSLWAVSSFLGTAQVFVTQAGTHRIPLRSKFDTESRSECDRAKVPPPNGNDPRPPLAI